MADRLDTGLRGTGLGESGEACSGPAPGNGQGRPSHRAWTVGGQRHDGERGELTMPLGTEPAGRAVSAFGEALHYRGR